MMCEASENEVDVNQHPSMPDEHNMESEKPVSNDTLVSHNANHVNKSDESSVNTDECCAPPEPNACSDNTGETVSESNVSSNEHDVIMEQDNRKKLQDVPENCHIKPKESNGVNSERMSENTSNQEINGHSNGTYTNEDQNREINDNHNGSGKS